MPEIALARRRRDADLSALHGLDAPPPGRGSRGAVHLDALLADEPLTGGLAPVLGDQHLRVVTVRGFPTSTWPGLLDELNRLGFALPLDDALPLPRQGRGANGSSQTPPAVVRQAQEHRGAAARNDLSAGKSAGRLRCGQQGGRRRRRAAGTRERCRGLRLHHGDASSSPTAIRPRSRRSARPSSGSSRAGASSRSPRRFNAVEAWLVSLPGPCVRQRAAADCLDLEPRAPHAALGRVGGTRAQRAPGRAAAHGHANRRRDAFSPGHPRRRRRPHAGRRARPAPASRCCSPRWSLQFRRYTQAHDLRLRQGRSVRATIWASAASTTTSAPTGRSRSSRSPASTTRLSAPGRPSGSRGSSHHEKVPTSRRK